MQYAIDEIAIPPSLRGKGARVWVGDSVLPAEELKEQGLRVVVAFLMRDVYGEIAIVFALPEKRQVNIGQIAECRRFALKWMTHWDKSSNKSLGSKVAGSVGRRCREPK